MVRIAGPACAQVESAAAGGKEQSRREPIIGGWEVTTIAARPRGAKGLVT